MACSIVVDYIVWASFVPIYALKKIGETEDEASMSGAITMESGQCLAIGNTLQLPTPYKVK